ncbi:MAG: T9SS type A sorting domain-containing protein [Gloeobacteraceae cyanobacterium ES-bin-316]|nr:T9SS type A sorting domain-containing protein [Ferruginibacter sp.]
MKFLLTILSFIFYASVSAQLISPGLTSAYEDKRQRVKLKWTHNDKRVTTYMLQRSSNNNLWIDFYRLSISQPQYSKFISYTDEQPGEGRNYYRLKAFLNDGSSHFTLPIMVIIGQPGNNWLMYPVPVKDILNLEYNGNALIPGVIAIFIQNTSGRVFHKLRYASSTRLIQIPVSNLGKGIYDIRIVINNKVVWNQRFVK